MNDLNQVKLFYYTDYNTFKLILQNGTLRFKESTSSNDKLDTIQLYDEFQKIAIERINHVDLPKEQGFIFKVLGREDYYGSNIALVACFSQKEDSRLLWDAYTMNRKDRESKRYNGVCIEFNVEKLRESMDSAFKIFNDNNIQPIIYGHEKIEGIISTSLTEFSSKVLELSKNEDQKQNIIPPISIQLFTKTIELDLKKCIVIPALELMYKFDMISPFIKHSFWREESEVRALLSIKRNSPNIDEICQHSNGFYYFDLPITEKCIKKIILGPEFNTADMEQLIDTKKAIDIEKINLVNSEGTGVIKSNG